jgi:hypothetical protein
MCPKKVLHLKRNVLDNDKLWTYMKEKKTKRNLNIIDYEKYEETFLKTYEIPIFVKDTSDFRDKELYDWLLSYEINDLIRILEANNIQFCKNGNIIKYNNSDDKII